MNTCPHLIRPPKLSKFTKIKPIYLPVASPLCHSCAAHISLQETIAEGTVHSQPPAAALSELQQHLHRGSPSQQLTTRPGPEPALSAQVRTPLTLLETPHRPGPGSPMGALQSKSYFLPALILQVSEQHCGLRFSARTCSCLLHLSQLLSPGSSKRLSSPLL